MYVGVRVCLHACRKLLDVVASAVLAKSANHIQSASYNCINQSRTFSICL
jgi:hypothetical protein